MEEIRSLQGMNKDVYKGVVPNGSYIHAENMVQLDEDGNISGLINERGFLEHLTLPEGFKVIGKTVLDKDIILFLKGSGSLIGTVRDGVYTTLVPSNGDLLNNELGFNINYPIDATARILATGDRMVYFTDNLNPMRYVNLDNPPPVGQIEDNIQIIQEQKLTRIDLKEILETTGNLRIGMYHFITRYVTEDLTPISFGIPSQGVPMVDETRSQGSFEYDGEYQDYGKVNKSIVLSLSNVDTSYPYIQVVVVYYEGSSNTPVAEALPIRNITSDQFDFVYSGDEETTPITQEELRVLPISYTVAKAVCQKDDRLFWSNLKDNSQEYDEELQKLFNNCTVEYVIQEVPYSDRLNNAGSLFDLITVYSLFNQEAPVEEDKRKIRLVFTSPPSDTTSVTNFLLDNAGVSAVGIINITDGTQLLGDTFTIGTTVFTGVNGVGTNVEYDVS